MALGTNVGTGFVPIKPDTKGFGDELERGVTTEGKAAAKRAGDGIGRELSLAMKGVFAAGVATIGKSVFDFAGFDKGMREVFTLLPDISAGAMDEMTAQVKDFAAEFGVLPDQVVPALYQSLSAGVPKDNVFAFLEDAQKLAKGGVTDLATAVDGLSGVVNAYGEEMGSAGAFSDMMFTTVKLGKTTIQDLSNNLFQVTPIASSLGVGFDQVSAAMAGLTLVTGNTSVASTQLKAALAELGKSGSTAFDSFVEATGQTFPDFIRSGGDLGTALVKMQDFAEANGKTLGDMFGSVEAGQAALVIANGNAEVFSSNLEQMRASSGATQEAFETMSTGLAATMDRLKARFAVSLLDLGESLAPTLEGMGMALADFLDLLNSLPAPLRTGIILGGTLAAGIAGFAGPILKAVQLFKLLGSTMTVLATNPWILAAGLLALAAYEIIKNWDKVKKFFGDLWRSIKSGLDKVVGVFRTAVGAIREIWSIFAHRDFIGVGPWAEDSPFVGALFKWRDRIAGVLEAIRGFFEDFVDGVRAVFDELANFFTVWADRFTFVFSHVFAWLSAAWTATWDAVSAATSTAAAAISSAAQPIVDVLQVTIPAALGFLQSMFETTWNAISSAVSGAWSVIAPIFDAVKSKVDDASRAIGALMAFGSAAFAILRSAVQTACSAIVTAINSVKSAAENALGPVGRVLSAAGGGIADAGRWLVGHDDGGVVGGGPRGAPMPILAHVGETVLPTHKVPIENFLGSAGAPPLVVETHLHVDAGMDETRFSRMLEEASTEVVRVVQRELARNDRGAGRVTQAVAA